jgi:hypothetical protein
MTSIAWGAGREFRLSDPPLLFLESSYSYNQTRGLAGTITLGGWNHLAPLSTSELTPATCPSS